MNFKETNETKGLHTETYSECGSGQNKTGIVELWKNLSVLLNGLR